MALDERSGHDLSGLLGSLQTLLLSTTSVQAFLQEVAELACAVVDPPASCGITTRYDHRPITIASSDSRAERIDQAQYTAGDGPCLHTLRTGEPTEIRDQSLDQRWQHYREVALEQGVAWVLSLPLKLDSRAVGALNLYGFDRPDAFTTDQHRRVELFAERAGTALALAIRHDQQRELSRQLEQALASRTVIDQAIGVLMAQQRCDADAAFDLLRQHSQNSNRKLRSVSADVIARFTGQPAGSPPPFAPPR